MRGGGGAGGRGCGGGEAPCDGPPYKAKPPARCPRRASLAAAEGAPSLEIVQQPEHLVVDAPIGGDINLSGTLTNTASLATLTLPVGIKVGALIAGYVLKSASSTCPP